MHSKHQGMPFMITNNLTVIPASITNVWMTGEYLKPKGDTGQYQQPGNDTKEYH